jgi:signal transduction histidine kinase
MVASGEPIPAAAQLGRIVVSAPVLVAPADRLHAELRAEATALLARRMRVGLWLLLAAIALFAMVEACVNPREMAALARVKLVQLATVAAAFWAIAHVAITFRRAVIITLFVLAEVCVTTAISGIITQDVVSIYLLLVVLTMGTAMVLPWGVWPQVAAVVVAGGAIGLNTWGVPGPHASLESLAVGVALAFATSIYAAHEFERYRLARKKAEEAHASATLVAVGREMMGLVDTALIVERLRSLTMQALDCDASQTLLWKPEQEAFVLVAAPGEPATPCTAVQPNALVARLQREELFEMRRNDPPAAGGCLCLYMALGRGEELLGIHTASFRNCTALSGQQRAIARGIAQIASMALTNARLVEDLARASRVKSEFLSTMSHELRTPLNAVLGYAEMLEDDTFDAAERRAFLDRIKTAGRDLLELIEGTLEIGRLEAGHGEITAAPVPLPSFWNAAREECARLPHPRDVCFEWDGDVPDVTLVTDVRKLIVVLRNLVGNAFKFTERGWVCARAAVEGAQVCFSVADTGIGIARDDQAIIFEMFRQVNGSDSRRYGGTGLGLYIVQRFVQQLGGSVQVHSAPGAGSTFTVALPLATQASVGAP